MNDAEQLFTSSRGMTDSQKLGAFNYLMGTIAVSSTPELTERISRSIEYGKATYPKPIDSEAARIAQNAYEIEMHAGETPAQYATRLSQRKFADAALAKEGRHLSHLRDNHSVEALH